MRFERDRRGRRAGLAALIVTVACATAVAAQQPSARETWRAYEDLMRAAEQARGSGDTVRAESLYLEAIETSRAFGEGNLRLGRAVEALADLYRESERLDDAVPLYERAIEIWERLLGPRQPHVATSAHNLAVVHLGRDEPERAGPLLERAIAIWERSRGADSPELAASLEVKAVLLQRTGRRDEAQPLLERVQRIRGRQPPGAD